MYEHCFCSHQCSKSRYRTGGREAIGWRARNGQNEPNGPITRRRTLNTETRGAAVPTVFGYSNHHHHHQHCHHPHYQYYHHHHRPPLRATTTASCCWWLLLALPSSWPARPDHRLRPYFLCARYKAVCACVRAAVSTYVRPPCCCNNSTLYDMYILRTLYLHHKVWRKRILV